MDDDTISQVFIDTWNNDVCFVHQITNGCICLLRKSEAFGQSLEWMMLDPEFILKFRSINATT